MALAILVAVFDLLAFLCPIGVYCFFLASINQRSRPLMVNGCWDAVGLLFALSGFALITVPTLASVLHALHRGHCRHLRVRSVVGALAGLLPDAHRRRVADDGMAGALDDDLPGRSGLVSERAGPGTLASLGMVGSFCCGSR